jgi:Tfp pilus assembly protein PilF
MIQNQMQELSQRAERCCEMALITNHHRQVIEGRLGLVYKYMQAGNLIRAKRTLEESEWLVKLTANAETPVAT